MEIGLFETINRVTTTIFESYLRHFSEYKPEEYKLVIIDNAGFHSTKNMKVPDTIFLLNIPPYSPELNPCEQVWQYIESRYKNKRFETMESLKTWLHKTVNKMSENIIKSITGNHQYLNTFNDVFYNLIGIKSLLRQSLIYGLQFVDFGDLWY